jgi:hypothetical protein
MPPPPPKKRHLVIRAFIARVDQYHNIMAVPEPDSRAMLIDHGLVDPDSDPNDPIRIKSNGGFGHFMNTNARIHANAIRYSMKSRLARNIGEPIDGVAIWATRLEAIPA